jgi:hypothetical protein
MAEQLSEMPAESVAVMFCLAYLVLWFYASIEWLWVILATTACVWFVRFVLALPDAERATLPPVSMLVVVFHCVTVYLMALNRRGNA